MVYKIGYCIGFCIGFIKNLINERREIRKAKKQGICPVELKTCPFCGGKPLFKKSNTLGYTIRCENPQCKVKPVAGWYGYLELAEKAWNTRAEN